MSNLHGVGATNGKSKRYQSIVSIAVALLVLIFAVSSWAQTTVGTGSINGTVTDPDGSGGEWRQGSHHQYWNRSGSQPDRQRRRRVRLWSSRPWHLQSASFGQGLQQRQTKQSQWKWATLPPPISSCNLARRARSLKCRPARSQSTPSRLRCKAS